MYRSNNKNTINKTIINWIIYYFTVPRSVSNIILLYYSAVRINQQVAYEFVSVGTLYRFLFLSTVGGLSTVIQ